MTLVFVLFIYYLFRSDRKNTAGFSKALWIPQAWMFFGGSRYISQWLNLRGTYRGSEAFSEGSPADRIVFLLLLVAAVFILSRRKLDWNKLITQNSWIWLYFAFGALSLLWSDFPLVAAKRLPKAVGNILMALVILTEKRPYEAALVVLRRSGYMLVPLSVLFIKWLPHLGRSYHMGAPMYNGVAFSKNALGQICLLAGISLFASLLLKRAKGQDLGGRLSNGLIAVVLGMLVWLMYVADSATSTACMVTVIGILCASRLPAFLKAPQRFITMGIVGLVTVGVVNAVIDLNAIVLGLLGRDANLTTRVPMWGRLKDMAGNSLFGVGFESFWLGTRIEAVWREFGDQITQAHNGYLEVYLSLGYIGLGLIAMSAVAGIAKIYKHLPVDYPMAILRLCFVVTALMYNWTEASFMGVNNMWTVFLLGALDITGQKVWECYTKPVDASVVAMEDKGPLKLGMPAFRYGPTRGPRKIT